MPAADLRYNSYAWWEAHRLPQLRVPLSEAQSGEYGYTVSDSIRAAGIDQQEIADITGKYVVLVIVFACRWPSTNGLLRRD